MASVFVKNSLISCVRKQSNILRFASSFQAAVLKEAASPLAIETTKRVSLKKKQVRIEVAYCSVNSADINNFNAETIKLPFTPGYELSGEIVEVGSNVESDEVSVGDKVAALNLGQFGGLAEECVVDVDDVWRIPPDLSLKDAAVVAFGHSTALYTFGILHKLKEKEENIIITAGPAGLGLAAIDIVANVYKSKVVAVTETEEHSELTRERGAFETIPFHKNLKKDILKIFGNKGADVAYDAAGGIMFEEIANCVAANGKLFYACPTIGRTIPTPPAHCSLTVVNLFKLKEQDVEAYRQIVTDTLEMAHEGIISANIGEEFKFKEVNKAIEYVKSRQCTGKVVVKFD